ncbi:MAG TPA: glycosyl hydrolase family 28 protein [Caulobacterales bacterium]|nr:glycosyl hydrolase family 28 protein [Caulobacterales bacterium]
MLDRRTLCLSAAALAIAPDAFGEPCEPGWVGDLRRELAAMAADLTRTLRPWRGPRRVFTPEAHGYRGEGLATAPIQAAIDAAAQNGGGTVALARGEYVSGTIVLRSNVRLEVGAGARLVGSTELADYPDHVARRPTVMDSNMGMNQSLIFAEACENISICGRGVIDGRGVKANFPGEETAGATPGRPFLIRVIDCTRVHVSDIRLLSSPCWMQNYLNCEDLLIERITVENQVNHNNDGIDIDGCRRVIVRDCVVNAEDDAMCFKGASQRPMHDVLVENCRFYSTCNALKFGTDSQGDFSRVLVRNLEVGGVPADMPATRRKRADSGIAWETVDGGAVENVMAQDIRIVRADSPFFLRLGDRGRVRPEQERPAPGNLRRIVYERITGADNGARGSYFTGIPEKRIEDVVLIDVDLHVAAASDPAPDQASIPEKPADYPDPPMIGPVSPAHGLWTRHLSGLDLIRVRFAPDAPDARPMLVATLDTSGVRISACM